MASAPSAYFRATGAALPPSSSGVIVGVGFVKWVAVFAVRFARIDARIPFATTKVLLHGDRFQVVRAKASAVSAQVVKVKAIGNGTDEQLEERPMDVLHAASAILEAADADQSVSVGLVGGPCPEPAPIFIGRLVDLGHDAFKKWFGGNSRHIWMVTQNTLVRI